jgi:hypothetical protein
MDRDDVAFPDVNEIAPHAIAFARMMFAHAEFERGIRTLVDAINTKEPGFGERHDNQWTASESGTAKIIVLIMRHRGSGRTFYASGVIIRRSPDFGVIDASKRLSFNSRSESR